MKPLKAKLKKKESNKTRGKLDRYEVVYHKLVTADGIYMRNMLISQLGYLNSMVSRADQQPGKDAYTRFEELKTEFENIKVEYGRLK